MPQKKRDPRSLRPKEVLLLDALQFANRQPGWHGATHEFLTERLWGPGARRNIKCLSPHVKQLRTYGHRIISMRDYGFILLES